MRYLLPIVSALAFTTPAFAQSVDAEGAARLAQDLSRYLGKDALDQKVVTVAVDGDAYRIGLDFSALASLIPARAKITFDIAPFSMQVKPVAGGQWDVTGDGLPSGSLQVVGPDGPQSMQWSIADGKFGGVYDPALAAFPTLSGSHSGMALASRETKQDMQATTGPGTFQTNGAAAAGGGVDFTYTQAVVDFVETLLIADEASGAKTPVTMKAAKLSIDGSGQGYRTRALLDLLAFGVANGDQARLRANQAELKNLLLAALPVWKRVDGAYHFGDFEVSTPVGAYGAKDLSIGFGMDGVVQDGSIVYRIGMAGLTAPAKTFPAATAPLLPTDLDLAVSGVGLDLDGMARKLIDGFDLNRQPPLPDAVTAEIAQAFLAKPPKVVISRSTVKNRDSEVALEGEVTFVGTEPQADVTIEVAGFDKLVENMHAASKDVPQLNQYLPIALVVKGFGKTQPDGRIRWAVVRKADGSVSVNGVTLKGPDSKPGSGAQ